MWQPSERYPDPAVRVLDPAFNQYRLMLASVERLYTGCRWSEGPVWFGDGRYLLWSDIPNNRDPAVGRGDRRGVGVPQALEQRERQHARSPGPARHVRARHAACHAHRVRRRDHRAGRHLPRQEAQLAERRRREVATARSGSPIPLFGILGYYEGQKDDSENTPAVYRLDAQTGQLAAMADDVPGPNGLAFSPDERKLYVVASRADAAPRRSSPTTWSRAARSSATGGCSSTPGRAARPTGSAWTSTAISGAAGEWARPSLDGVRVFDAERPADRPHRPAGALRQPVLRRPLPQPPLHGGEPQPLRALREHAGRGRRLTGPPGVLSSA